MIISIKAFHVLFSETTDSVFASVSSSYQIIKPRVNWPYAQAHCYAIHGHLAAFETEDEFTSISAHIPGEGHHIGINDIKDEMKYVWEHSGQELGTYQPWASNEPSNVTWENCGMVDKGKFYDMSCQLFFMPFICEFAKQ